MTDDAAETRAWAEELLENARARLAEAEARAAAIDLAAQERAEEMVVDVREPGQTGEDHHVVREASAVADRILRVARSEAEARSRELIEHARRRADQIERDARQRMEHATREHRELVRRMQEQQLDATARLRRLESEIAAKERRLGRLHDEALRRGIADEPEPVDELHSGIEFPGAPVPSTPAGEHPSPARPQSPRRESQGPRTGRAEDPDVEKALRSIRRRA